MVTLDKSGHREPLRGVLYNSAFHVAVSVDEGGTVCVWCMQVSPPVFYLCCKAVGEPAAPRLMQAPCLVCST
jgi:hypothetical protein